MINLYTEKIEDKSTREAFSDLQQEMDRMPFVSGNWQFIEVDASGAVSGGDDSGELNDDVGEIVAFPRHKSNPPHKFLFCGGGSYNALEYPALAQQLWDTDTLKYKYGGTGTFPEGTFNVPNIEGRFLRGVANGSDSDPDRDVRTLMAAGGNAGDRVGSVQGHAFQTHTHTQNGHQHYVSSNVGNAGAPPASNQLGNNYVASWAYASSYDTSYTLMGTGTAANVGLSSAVSATNNNAVASGSHSQATASETRPVNIYVNFFIRYEASNKGAKGDKGEPGAVGEITGVVKDFIGKTLPPGYIFADGRTIGNESSLATNRANEDTFNLFKLLWEDYDAINDSIFLSDTSGNIQPRGASARADFDLNYKITVPDLRGYTTVGRDNMGGSSANRITTGGSGLDGTKMLAVGGAQTHTLTEAQMPAHNHSINDPGHKHNVYGGDSGGYTTYMQTRNNSTTQVNPVQIAYTGITINNKGGGQAHNNVQPSRIVNKIIAL